MRFATPVTENIMLAFGTPILVRQVPDFERVNPGFAAKIREARKNDGGSAISNRGGWQSSPTLWDWDGEEIAEFRRWVHNAVLQIAALTTEETDLDRVDVKYNIGAWANINSEGDYNERHIHPDADWAVVYYVEIGTPESGFEKNGKLEIYDPRTLASSSHMSGYGFARGLVIDPEPGKMVLFPAWVEHGVHPFHGEGDRISVAANVKILGGRHAGFK